MIRTTLIACAGMALAGPIANAILATLALVAIKVGLASGWWERGFEGGFHGFIVAVGDSGGLAGLASFLSVLFALNVLLFLFNLMPFPPLDGAAIVHGLVPPARPFYDWLGEMPMGSLIGILLAWWAFKFVWVLVPFWLLI